MTLQSGKYDTGSHAHTSEETLGRNLSSLVVFASSDRRIMPTVCQLLALGRDGEKRQVS